MSQSKNKLDYLQKYLSGPTGSENKKKKKRPKIKGNGMKIIDDDFDVSKIRELDHDELEILGGGEDAPIIVGIIDERPEHVKVAEHYSKDKWKVITQDDGFNSTITVKNDKIKPSQNNENSSDSDLSPVRNKNEVNAQKQIKKLSHRTGTEDSNSDLSAIMHRKEKVTRKGSDSDLSPVRQKKSKVTRKGSDSDLSPVRQKKSKVTRKGSDSDLSPIRQRKDKVTRKGSDSDLSPVRQKKDKVTRKGSDSDLSPVRQRKDKVTRKSSDSDLSPARQRRDKITRKGSDSDMSPPRSRHKSNDEKSHKNRTKPRKSRWDTENDFRMDQDSYNSKEHDQNRDYDRKPRVETNDSSKYSGSRNRFEENTKDRYKGKQYKDDAREPTRVEKTLDGKKAGLQDARHLKEETQEFKRKEDEIFGKLSEDLTGRHAKAIKRNLGKRETSEDREKQKQKEEKQKELDAKYDRWGKGVKQMEDREARIKDFMHEAAKPLARYKDDKDLENSLRNKERDGDPMLEYMRRKEKESGIVAGEPERPIYKGAFPPNRFNIRPGHRWDGVDRSNGHEKNYFAANSKRAALEAEKYKWSTEDM